MVGGTWSCTHRKSGQALALTEGATVCLWHLCRSCSCQARVQQTHLMSAVADCPLLPGSPPPPHTHTPPHPTPRAPVQVDLWKTSGHFDFYSENMYDQMQVETEEYQLKPMNCPFHVAMYKDGYHSYRDLPIRMAELGTVYRCVFLCWWGGGVAQRGGEVVLGGCWGVQGGAPEDGYRLSCAPCKDGATGCVDEARGWGHVQGRIPLI
jgi:hypothetical protein